MIDYLSDIFYEKRVDELRHRVNESRFKHSMSVSQMAIELARVYDVDEKKARLAGVLHDWDKGYSLEEIKQRARYFGVDAPEVVYELMPRVLHAQTAACALQEEYPGMPQDITQAIARHTSAAPNMTALDMVIYVADALEPLRSFDDLKVIRDRIGKISLEELFFVTFTDILKSLIRQEKTINPLSVDVWNHYTTKQKNDQREEITT